MFSIDLAIKFGSDEIIIYRKGMGIIAKEPAYLALTKSDKPKVKAYGLKAKKLFESEANQVTVYRPIQCSEVVDEKMAVELISNILKNVILDKFTLTRINAIVAVPCALNEGQLLSLKRVLQMSGISKITFVQNSVCARTNLDIDSHSHIMVVDIGAYITDISVLNEYNFSFGRMYFIGGNDMDKSITTFIADNHNLEVDDQTSKRVKNEIASLYERDQYRAEYLGLDDNKKIVKHEITANEIRVAIVNIYDLIFSKIEEIIKLLPKDVMADIYNNGVMFIGGASSIAGLYEYAKKKLDLPVIVPENPSDSVILGAGKLLNSDVDYLKIKL